MMFLTFRIRTSIVKTVLLVKMSRRSSFRKSVLQSFASESTENTWTAMKPFTQQEMVFNRMPGWIGEHLTRLELHKKGLRYFNEALEKNVMNTNVLFERAKAYGKCFDMQKGLADCEKLVKMDPSNADAVARRISFLNLNGEFEKCLILNYNHLKVRKQPPVFTLGLLTAQNTLEDCIGKRAGHPLRDHYEIIREEAWQKNAMKVRGEPKQRRKRRKIRAPIATTDVRIIGSVKPQKPLKPLNMILEEDEEEEEEEVCVQDLTNITSSKTSFLKKERKHKKAGFSDKITRVQNIPRAPKITNHNMHQKSRSRFSVDSTKGDSVASLSNMSFVTDITGSLTEKFSPIVVPKVSSYPYHPLQRKTTNIENYMACSYLGALFPQKRYLSGICKNPGYMGKNEDGNRSIVDLTKEGINLLEGLQEILHTRKPFYNIKYQEFLTRSKKVEMDKMKLIESQKINVIKKLNRYFDKIAQYVKRMDIRRMNKIGEFMYRYCKNTNKAIIPGRNMILCRLFRLLGDGILFSYRFLPGMTEQQMITRVNLALGLPIDRRISQESFYRRFKGRGLNWVDLINTFEQRVRICKYSEEAIWLYHELTKFNLELKRYTLAKTYCGRCIHEARKCEDFKWAVNGYMTMTRIAVFQKNKNDARKNLRMAITTAKNVDMTELDAFLQTCLGVVNEWKFEKENVDEMFQRRQQGIIQVIQSYEKKREAVLLFDYMRVKPPDRRLPIIPGFVDTDEYDVIERSKEERRKKKMLAEGKRGTEAENMINGYLGRWHDRNMDI